MKIDKVHVYGFEPALYGMRNPKESWDRSDSTLGTWEGFRDKDITCPERPYIGPKDMQLARRLITAGSDHRKFLRQIMVWWNISIPRYIWQELDTYKVATVRNSCSTMHKLRSRDLKPCDFQDEDVHPDVLQAQNIMGKAYREKSPCGYGLITGIDLLAHMKRRLPEGFLQMATYSFSYETALNMYRSRHNHRMSEWSGPDGICVWLQRLPYLADFISCTMGKV
jgi:hypothetical protein